MEESEGGGDVQGDGDRTLGDADSSCCEDENRPAEVKETLEVSIFNIPNISKIYLSLNVLLFLI